MTYGGVIISGNHIVAGSLTASQIDVNTLSAFNTTTGSLAVDGNLTVGTTGKIFSTGKTSPSVSPANGGFFLGYDNTSPAGYKFYVGEGGDSMQWSPGNGLLLESNNALLLMSTGAGDTSPADVESTKIFNFVRVNANTNQKDLSVWHALTGIKADGDWEFLADVKVGGDLTVSGTATLSVKTLDIGNTSANDYTAMTFTEGGQTGRFRYGASGALPKRLDWMEDMWVEKGLVVNGGLQTNGAVINIKTPARNIGSSNMPGSAGDICWGGSATAGATQYLYICVATDDWRRIPVGGTF
jgi:hypothetical protein